MGRNRGITRGLLAGCSLVALMGSSTIAVAQDAVSVTDLGRVGTTEGAPGSTVTPSSTGDRAQAKEQKKEAPNLIEVQPYTEIQKLPDVTAAEALQRIPGISMESDSGEGRFINIRGLDADLNGTTYDGVRLTASNQSSPLGGSRAVAFDAFPAGAIGGIQVIKTLTPEDDAEGLGGVVNLLPRSLPADGSPFLDAGFGAGWEPLRNTAVFKGDITAGTRFGLDSATAPWNFSDGASGDRPFGIIATFSRYDDERNIDDLEQDYSDTAGIPNKALSDLQMRWYEYRRSRQGGGGEFSYQPDPQNSFYIRVLDSGYEEQADKHRLELDGLDGSNGTLTALPNGSYQVTNATARQVFTDTDENIENRLIAIGGHSVLFDKVKLDYRASWTDGTDAMPTSFSTTFKNPNSFNLTYNNTNPNAETWQANGINLADPSQYVLTSRTNSPFQDSDWEYALATDASFAAGLAGYDGQAKLGVSIRLRTRGNSQDQTSYAPAGTVALGGLTQGGDQIYYNGLYNIGPNVSNAAVNGAGFVPVFAGVDPTLNGDLISNQEAWQHDTENVYAGYGQYSLTIDQLALIGGLRVEATDATYKANIGTTDPTGTFTTITPTSSSTSYTDVFPSIQAKYSFSDQLIGRAAFSTAIARPGFNQITAARTVDLSQDVVSQGNPSLKPTTGQNYDLTLEYYLPNGGILAGGAFDKEFDNYIVPTGVFLDNFQGTGETFMSNSFKNISGSEVRGLEVQYTQQFTFLPAPFNGFGFDSNYTYNHSRGQIRPGEFEPLPSTSPQNFNAAIFYEAGPVTARVASSYVSRNLFSVGGDRNTDIFSSPRFRLDLQTSYAITPNLIAGFDAKNISNTPLEFTESQVASRPIQREFYDATYLFSLRLKV